MLTPYDIRGTLSANHIAWSTRQAIIDSQIDIAANSNPETQEAIAAFSAYCDRWLRGEVFDFKP